MAQVCTWVSFEEVQASLEDLEGVCEDFWGSFGLNRAQDTELSSCLVKTKCHLYKKMRMLWSCGGLEGIGFCESK